ncbi:MAG TPA: hypothetical protein DEB09_04175 [Candidatus Magasanikbacteria bacterium]|nr:hypothetical protein [Candidatus Magasanikbacteria bacterium]
MEDEINQEWKLASMRTRFDVLKIANPKDGTVNRLNIDKLNPEKMYYWEQYQNFLKEMGDLRTKNLAEMKLLLKKVSELSNRMIEAAKDESKKIDIKTESPFCGWLNNRLYVLSNYVQLIIDNFVDNQSRLECIGGIEKEVAEFGEDRN